MGYFLTKVVGEESKITSFCLQPLRTVFNGKVIVKLGKETWQYDPNPSWVKRISCIALLFLTAIGFIIYLLDKKSSVTGEIKEMKDPYSNVVKAIRSDDSVVQLTLLNETGVDISKTNLVGCSLNKLAYVELIPDDYKSFFVRARGYNNSITYACSQGKLEVAKKLYELGVPLNQSAIEGAILSGNAKVFAWAVSTLKQPYTKEMLQQALVAGKTDIANFLTIKVSSNDFAYIAVDDGLLIWAITYFVKEKKNFDCFDCLLAKVKDLTVFDTSGLTGAMQNSGYQDQIRKKVEAEALKRKRQLTP